MYFVRKKDLIIVGRDTTHIVEFQMEDYCCITGAKVRILEPITKI